VEGPTVLRINGEWIVYYDQYRDHRVTAYFTDKVRKGDIILGVRGNEHVKLRIADALG
jgi:hypothetical protein